jgi:putative phosphoesterase
MKSGSVSILVLSDSHGDIAALTAVLEWARKKKFAGAVFLGDGAEDLKFASAIAGFTLPWDIVRGNVDTNFSLPGTLVLEVPKNSKHPRKLFLSHGNMYRVEEDCRALAAAARANGAEAAFFGHTHIPCCAMLDGIFLLNPGSIGRPRSKIGPTFAVLDCPPVKATEDAIGEIHITAKPLDARFFCLVRKSKKTTIIKEIDI